MDRISDSGSDGCGSIPHGATKKSADHQPTFLCLSAPLVQPAEVFSMPHQSILWL